MKKYWWRELKYPENDPTIITGRHALCYDGKLNYDYYIEDIERCYYPDKTKFGDAKFCWVGPVNEEYTRDNILNAQTIEEAKKEFEEWYTKYLHNRYIKTQAIANKAKEEYQAFMDYRVEKGS